MDENRETKKEVLGDHFREGKVLKPPLSRLPLKETSWVRKTLPELLWIGRLQEAYGMSHGVDLCLGLAEVAIEARSSTTNVAWFAATRSYAALDETEWRNVRRVLKESGKLNDITFALAPLAPLFTEAPPQLSNREERFSDFKGLLESLYNKQERPAILVQATAVYIALVTGKVILAENMTVGNLEAVTNFPRTEESQMVAASVRSMCNFLIGMPHPDNDPGWADYFWARGFELEKCEYELPYEL